MIYSITEGQQAEEYKARKAKEVEDAKKAEENRYNQRYGDDPRGGGTTKGFYVGDRVTSKHPGFGSSKKINDDYHMDGVRSRAADDMIKRNKISTKCNVKGLNDYRKKIYPVKDAINRHMRHHPINTKNLVASFLV